MLEVQAITVIAERDRKNSTGAVCLASHRRVTWLLTIYDFRHVSAQLSFVYNNELSFHLQYSTLSSSTYITSSNVRFGAISEYFNQLVKDILNDPPWNKIEIPVDFENPLLRDLINIDDKREAEFWEEIWFGWRGVWGILFRVRNLAQFFL